MICSPRAEERTCTDRAWGRDWVSAGAGAWNGSGDRKQNVAEDEA